MLFDHTLPCNDSTAENESSDSGPVAPSATNCVLAKHFLGLNMKKEPCPIARKKVHLKQSSRESQDLRQSCLYPHFPTASRSGIRLRSSSRLLDRAFFDNVRGWTPTPT